MAKALLGYVGGPDPRMIAEVRRLQRRVAELESDLVRVRSHNDTLNAELARVELLSVGLVEPALT